MKIALSGSHGFIGSALKTHLESEQHEVIPLIRESKSVKEKGIVWNPEIGHVETRLLAGVDAVIHLAGENIFGPWTKRKKERIRHSRVVGTPLCANVT